MTSDGRGSLDKLAVNLVEVHKVVRASGGESQLDCDLASRGRPGTRRGEVKGERLQGCMPQ